MKEDSWKALNYFDFKQLTYHTAVTLRSIYLCLVYFFNYQFYYYLSNIYSPVASETNLFSIQYNPSFFPMSVLFPSCFEILENSNIILSFLEHTSDFCDRFNASPERIFLRGLSFFPRLSIIWWFTLRRRIKWILDYNDLFFSGVNYKECLQTNLTNQKGFIFALLVYKSREILRNSSCNGCKI